MLTVNKLLFSQALQEKKNNSNNLQQTASFKINKDVFISFKGSEEPSKKEYLQELHQLEKELFETKGLGKDPERLIKITFEICQPLAQLSQMGEKVSIDTEAYFELAQDIMELSEEYPEYEEELCERAKDLMYIANAYGYSNDEMITKVDQYFTDLIMQDPLSQKANSVIHYFAISDKNKDNDWLQLCKTRGKIRKAEFDNNKLEFNKQRTKLFQQEFDILLQEITEPEKYFDRAVRMGAFDYIPEKADEAYDYLQIIALEGLYILLRETKKFNIKSNTIKHNELADLIIHLNKNSDRSIYSEDLNVITYELLSLIYNDVSKDKQSYVEDIARQNKDVNFVLEKKSPADQMFKEIEKQLLTDLKKPNSSNKIKRVTLFNLVRMGCKEISDDIRNVLLDPAANKELKTIAVWAAGKYPEPEIIDKVIEIINPDKPFKINSSNIGEYRQKEIALSSLVESKAPRIREVLTKIANSDSDFAKTAKIYLDKVEGKFDKDSDFVLKQMLQSSLERQNYLKLRNKFIKPVRNKLSNEDINWIDRTLIPFRLALKSVVNEGSSLSITNDLISPAGLLGMRSRGGGFSEFNFGSTMTQGSVDINIVKHFSNPSNGDFVFSHEWGHKLQGYLMEHYPDDFKTFYSLFKTAIETDNTLDSYAETCINEYFAQVCEAYLTDYKPHKLIIYNDSHQNHLSNTSHTLLRKNPELYKYFEKLYQKFNKMNLTRQLDLSA